MYMIIYFLSCSLFFSVLYFPWRKYGAKFLGGIPVKMRFTQSNVSTLTVKDKPYCITDEGCDNLQLYVGTRNKTWYVDYRETNGKKAHRKLGAADALTVAQAREMARDVATKVAKGEKVKKEKPPEKLTLGKFFESAYFPHLRLNHKSAKEISRALSAAFKPLYNVPAEEVSPVYIEKWREKLHETGLKSASINRTTAYLKAAFNWAFKTGIIDKNPIARISPLKEHDSKTVIRYLDKEERERLETALIEREKNKREKGLCVTGEFADYLRPAVLLSLVTGIRQGALFALT
jgi:hypothetical protein